MMPNLRAIRGKLSESTTQRLIDISKLDPNTRLLTGRLFGDYYPVETSFGAGENLVTIDLPIPRIVGAKSKRIDDSRKGLLSIKKLRDETHILSLDVKGFGNLYTDMIDISDEVLNALIGDSKDNCGMFHMGQNRLMAVLYDDGYAVDFTGGYLVPEKPDPIVEFITVGYKGLLGQGTTEAESVAETVEEPSEKIIDAETIKKETIEIEFNPSVKVSAEEAMEILGRNRVNYKNFCKNNPDLVEDDGGMTYEGIARYAVGSKGPRLKEEKRLEILERIKVYADDLESASDLLKQNGIEVEPGITFREKLLSLNESFHFDELSKILGTSESAAGYIKSLTRRRPTRQFLTKHAVETGNISILNTIYGKSFESMENALNYLNSKYRVFNFEIPGTKKKLD